MVELVSRQETGIDGGPPDGHPALSGSSSGEEARKFVNPRVELARRQELVQALHRCDSPKPIENAAAYPDCENSITVMAYYLACIEYDAGATGKLVLSGALLFGCPFLTKMTCSTNPEFFSGCPATQRPAQLQQTNRLLLQGDRFC
ncbi:hypothetical protein HFN63_36885 [Rhizobium leguminosarum]|uniref:hypothetical protein n=1 Tax=Rhizobium leguminosarum TaxID=384 RepID=UPI001C9726E2|nr:hypothetical protein [Rhizobium leguminosarum]MBY5775485.1 hypothetical protein [Rhizobium leguminosarum]